MTALYTCDGEWGPACWRERVGIGDFSEAAMKEVARKSSVTEPGHKCSPEEEEKELFS